MSVEKHMQTYIDKTKMGNITPYSLTFDEINFVHYSVASNKLFEAMWLLYKYGMAKGYRKAVRDRRKNARSQS